MKKFKLLSLCIAILGVTSVHASTVHRISNSDTTSPAKHDTSYVPVYIIQSTDTLKARIVVVEKNGTLGLVRGFVFMQGVKNEKGQWLKQPSVNYMDAGYLPVRQEVLTAF